MPAGPRVSASFQYVFLKLTCGQGVSKIGGCDCRTLVGRLPRGAGGGGRDEVLSGLGTDTGVKSA